MVPGMNSNPEKNPTIADQPHGPFELAFYLFCDLAPVSATSRALWTELRKPEWDLRALLCMEASGVKHQALSALATLDWEHFVRVIPSMVDALVWHDSDGASVCRTTGAVTLRGRVPRASRDRFDATRQRVLQLVLLMDLSLAIDRQRDAVNAFREYLRTADRPVVAPETLEAITGARRPGSDESKNIPFRFHQLSERALHGAPINAADLFVAGYQVFDACRNAPCGPLADRFAHFLLEAWRDVVINHAFLIRTPILARQTVERLGSSSYHGVARLAEIALELEAFVQVQVAPTLREDLRLAMRS